MPESVAAATVARLDSGEQKCDLTLLLLSSFYKEDSLVPFVRSKRATIKNESGKTIANVQLKSTYKRSGDYVCDFSTTVSLPKANFYSFYVGGLLILDSVPLNKVKSGKGSVSLSDYQP